MRAMMMVGGALCMLAVCALEGNGISLVQAVCMAAVGMPMMLVGAAKGDLYE